MKITNSNGVLTFVAEGIEELPLAVRLAHDQAIMFREPFWCDKCNEFHTLKEMTIKHPSRRIAS